jgi:hypothetical protein
MNISTRKGVTVALAAALAAAGIVLPATSAQAAPYTLPAPSLQIGYTDSATPGQAYDWAEQVNLPLGSHVDDAGVVHTSRVYATYDLTPLAGKKIVGADLRIREAEVADCTKRAIEVWEVSQIHRTPSWDKAPKANAKLDEITTATTYCFAYIAFDVNAAVAEAIGKGKEKISFEIRVPAGLEADPSYARTLNWYNSVSLGVRYNSVPTIDDYHMYQEGRRCDGTPAVISGGLWLQGLAADADENDQQYLTIETAVWPQADPAARRVYTATSSWRGRVATVTVPGADLIDGQAYSWQYRASDGLDTTAWSRSCDFLVDDTRPGPPTVSSTNYPRGDQAPLGEPGIFTFSGNGDPDTVGFEWTFMGFGVNVCAWNAGDVGQVVCNDVFSLPHTARADVPGGTATVAISPERSGPARLLVRALDAAGNPSAETVYNFWAPEQGDPVATVVGSAVWNHPVTVRLSAGPGITGTTRFEYRLDGGQTQVLPAGEDGTATFTFLASNEYGHQVSFRSFSANGWVSPETTWYVDFYPWPTITSDVYSESGDPTGGVGVPGTFTFGPPAGWTEVTGYRYSINGGEQIYVVAEADGTASVVWAPTYSDWNYVDVYAVAPDGSTGDYSGSFWFNVA